MATEEKIYGAFTYKNMKDRINKDWSKKVTAPTLSAINEKANKLIESGKHHSVDLMIYEPKKMAWALISSKFKSALK
jgi:hypothetical protein